VDARNPFFFYSKDLERYIEEVGEGAKKFLLVINKADYLTEELRVYWSKYFSEKKVDHIFFSALIEQEKMEQEVSDDEEAEEEQEEEHEEKADTEAA